MAVEVTGLGTYFDKDMQLIESKPFSIVEGADLLLHLFDSQKLKGRVLRTEPTRALIEVAEIRWWLERSESGEVGRWVVRARDGAEQHSCKDPAQIV